ncbi:MAG: hypothetical protein PHR53_07590 [Bacteroidales bacterium]|nr:hypothetical protein [Bacteroidales bacterium]
MKHMIHVLFLAAISATMFSSAAQNTKAIQKGIFKSSDSYEVQVLGVGQDGTKVFRIWSFDRTVDAAVLKAQRDAVAACMFTGLPGSSYTNPTPALCSAADIDAHQDFFDTFFAYPQKDGSGGEYLRFIQRTSDETPSGDLRIKTKSGFKVAIDVQVLYNNLRQYLETAGIIKALNSGF